MNNTRAGLVGAIALALIACGASKCLDPHNPIRAGAGGPSIPAVLPHLVNLGGVRHADGYCTPIPKCAECHGDSLRGGVNGEPSCTKCHVEFWNLPNCGMVAHTVNFGGHLHALGYCTPLTNCVTCHGAQLEGGRNGEPSCTKCHITFWNLPNCGMVAHTVNLGGHLHAPGYCTPLTNCVTCHGAQLLGGRNGEPSCTSCHGQNWNGSDCGD
jgi:hypothetical protein